MFTKELERAFNEQMKWEIYSAYLYLSMAAYFEVKGLDGFAKWFKAQTAEELMHASKFYNFIIERGSKIILEEIPKPPSEFKSPIDVFEFALNHEKEVTKRINTLVELSKKENDHASQIFLQWFVSEQIEEEFSFGSIVEKLKMTEGSLQGILFLDKELSQRPLDLNQIFMFNK